MLARLAPVLVRSRRRVLVLALLFLVLAGAVGGGVAQELSAGGFDDAASESSRASALLEREFGAGAPNLALLVTAPGGVGSVAAVAAGEALVARLAAEPGVTAVTSWWTSGRPAPLLSRDLTRTVVLARLTGGEDAQIDRVEALGPRYRGTAGPLTVEVGGETEVFRQVGDTIEHDLARAESVAVPVTAVLLVLVFGSAVAAVLPLLVGVLSILGTFLFLHLLAQATPVSVYAVNLAVSLGLGLGIDYSLFLLTRYREEVAGGVDRGEAVVTMLRTAGRTVLFSALTVLLSLSALLVFPLYFLRSFAYAGIGAVLFALLGALLVLPAAVAALGDRLDRYDLRKALRIPRGSGGFWHGLALRVMRRPVGFGTAVVVLLLVAGAPFLDVRFGLPDDRVLPREASGHTVAETLRTAFPSNEPLALSVVTPGSAPDLALARFASRLSALPDVDRVDALSGSYAGGLRVAAPTPASVRFGAGPGSWLSVVPAGDGYGRAAEQLVRDLRAVPSPTGEALVGGQAAALVDTKASLGGKLPLALGLIGLATFVLLFLFTGSVVVPVKAVVLNLLSLTATFGAMVWVFQEGHLTGLIGDPIVTGTLDTTIPILMFCVLFGLSMDYEVFLLSRIKEEYDLTGDNTRAVALGLERTGGLVTAAAGLLALVFLSFVSSDIAFIKLLGLGTALAVLVDASLVRGILVPAFMRLAGDLNWWAPAPLRKVHERVGLREELVDA